MGMEVKMKDCSTCVNLHKGKCEVMTSRPGELFCWADKEMAIKREREIAEYMSTKSVYATEKEAYKLKQASVFANRRVKVLMGR